jgi:cytochrome c
LGRATPEALRTCRPTHTVPMTGKAEDGGGNTSVGRCGARTTVVIGERVNWILDFARVAVAGVLLASAARASAFDGASRDEAVAMVKRAIDFIQLNGKDKGYAEISDKRGRFQDRDLYLVVLGLDGVVRAHGGNERMIGRNLIDLRDGEGRPFMQERMQLARTKPVFWQDYKPANPVTKAVEPKQMYCERLDDAIVCGGIFKR